MLNILWLVIKYAVVVKEWKYTDDYVHLIGGIFLTNL